MATVNQFVNPGFVVTIEQFANPVLEFTVLDRAGNVIDLTGYALKLAVVKTVNRSNGLGQILPTDISLFDQDAVITSPTMGNISFSNVFVGTPGAFRASLRIWNTTSTVRLPDDAYSGTYVVTRPAVKEIV